MIVTGSCREGTPEPAPETPDETPAQVDPVVDARSSATGNGPTLYPIPPVGVPDRPSLDEPAEQRVDRPGNQGAGTGSVPTWAFRGAAQAQVGPASYGDLALDPMSLRSKVTLRAGTASMVVDDSGLSLRARMRRSTISWAEVLGFEPRIEADGTDARLVAITSSGPVELAATRGPVGEVRYIHALLDAYRQRAAIIG